MNHNMLDIGGTMNKLMRYESFDSDLSMQKFECWLKKEMLKIKREYEKARGYSDRMYISMSILKEAEDDGTHIAFNNEYFNNESEDKNYKLSYFGELKDEQD